MKYEDILNERIKRMCVVIDSMKLYKSDPEKQEQFNAAVIWNPEEAKKSASTYKTVKKIEYDWIKIPIGTIVNKSEEWRKHETLNHIAMFVLSDGQICPMFFDEVVEAERCKFCGGDGLSYTGVEHSGMHQTEECQGCEGMGWRKMEVEHETRL